MEVNYKYCKRCETKVSLNATQCLVCNSREFITQAEVDEAAKALLEFVSAQQQRALDASPLARLKKFVGLGSRQ